MAPKGWEAVEVDDLAKISSGGTPSKQNEAYWNGSEPWISGKDLKTHYLYSSIDKLTDEGFAAAKKAPKGSTLILVRGMTLLKDFPVGYATRELSFNQDVKALVPSKNVDGLYLSFLLSGDKHKIMNLVSTAGHGTGRLDTNLLKQHPVNLPPLLEQQKIAKILSTWDKAIGTTERLIDNSTQQKKALMQQLLTGEKRLLDDEGKRFAGEWEEVKLSAVAQITMGSSPKSEAYNEVGDGLPLLQGNADIKNRKSVPRIYTSQITKECHVDDILFSVRAPVGTVALSNHHACIGRGIAAIKAKENHSQDYLYQWLLSFELKWERYSQGSTFEAVNSNDIKSLNLSVPNLKEQQKIATVLTNVDKEIELLEQQLADLQQEKKALMQVLLTGKRRVMVDGDNA